MLGVSVFRLVSTSGQGGGVKFCQFCHFKVSNEPDHFVSYEESAHSISPIGISRWALYECVVANERSRGISKQIHSTQCLGI